MFPTSRWLALATCGTVLGVGGWTASAQAAPVARPSPAAPMVRPSNLTPNQWNHNRFPPGWDWQRTYPWSSYNLRNPLNPYSPYYGQWAGPVILPPVNPIIVQPMINPVQVVQPIEVGTAAPAAAPLPRAIGPVQTAPANAGVIVVKLRDAGARVAIHGQVIPGLSAVRYYLTPPLSANGTATYNLGATVLRNGQPAQDVRPIPVAAGQVVTVDFTR